MKNIVGALIVGASLAGCGNAPDYTDIKLSVGAVRVYDFGEYKLHAYDTQDAMTDIAFLVETPKTLIGIEGPAFANTIIAWRDYIATQSKPLTAVLSSYHPNPWYGSVPNYATSDALSSRTHGEIHALVNSLGVAFGPEFDARVASNPQMLNIGDNIIDGVHFVVADDAGGYTIEIPEMNILYVHMLGADSHSILSSLEHMEVLISQLKEYKKKNYTLILSGHHMPETVEALDAKIAYVQTVRDLAKSSKTPDEFKGKMKDKFPNFSGENYLDMTADNLFK